MPPRRSSRLLAGATDDTKEVTSKRKAATPAKKAAPAKRKATTSKTSPTKRVPSSTAKTAAAPKKRGRRKKEEEDEEEEQVKPAKKKARKAKAKPTTHVAKKAKMNSKKEESDEDGDEEEEEEDKPQMARIVKKGRAAVDEHCPIKDSCHVHFDDDSVWTATLMQADRDRNNNKFYNIQVLKSDKSSQYYCFQRWGRVGAKGQHSMVGPFPSASRATSAFQSKFLAKTKNPWSNRDNFVTYPKLYTLIKKDYGEDSESVEEINARMKARQAQLDDQSTDVESTLHPRVQNLVRELFDVDTMNLTLSELEFDASRMPLGKLDKDTIKQGYSVLKDISTAINTTGANRSNALKELSNRFFTLIPHNFGMQRIPIISDAKTLKRKMDMLEALLDIEIATSIIKDDSSDETNVLDHHYEALHADISPLDQDSEEWKMIEKYVNQTHAATHSQYKLQLEDVYIVDRNGEEKNFRKHCDTIQPDNRMMLWHGSRTSNFVGILSQGLRIAPPEAPVTGYMFGKGVYFADSVSKSANYCWTNASNPYGYLLISEVALGKPRELTCAEYIEKLPKGYHSTKGCGKTAPNPAENVLLENGATVPLGKMKQTEIKQGHLLYNEYIVYDTKQINLKYLLKCKFNYNNR